VGKGEGECCASNEVVVSTTNSAFLTLTSHIFLESERQDAKTNKKMMQGSISLLNGGHNCKSYFVKVGAVVYLKKPGKAEKGGAMTELKKLSSRTR